MTRRSGQLSTAELRELFLFSDLADDQLAWVAAAGQVIDVPASTVLAMEGEPAECFYVLLSGTLSMSRRVRDTDVEIVRTAERGVFCGAVQFYFGDHETRRYATTSRAVSNCSFLLLSAPEFAAVFRQWFPMAIHLLRGMFVALHTTEELAGLQERLSALGALTAGLMHELNNPAAAAESAAAALADRTGELWTAWGELNAGPVSRDQLQRILALRAELVSRTGEQTPVDALALSDSEDAVAEWLTAHSVEPAWEVAPVLVAAGVTEQELTKVAVATDGVSLAPALRWLATAVDVAALTTEIGVATRRVSDLVDTARQYSQLDTTPFQPTDLAAGLDATLVLLSHAIGPGVAVLKDYDTALPAVPGRAAELNQVWTNLVQNALEAMAGEGTLTLRIAVDVGWAVIEVGDTGPGVPPGLRTRVFEPFFTTKTVGSGPGLGLDIARRIVVDRHHGDLRLLSRPGRTRFQVRLPLETGPA